MSGISAGMRIVPVAAAVAAAALVAGCGGGGGGSPAAAVAPPPAKTYPSGQYGKALVLTIPGATTSVTALASPSAAGSDATLTQGATSAALTVTGGPSTGTLPMIQSSAGADIKSYKGFNGSGNDAELLIVKSVTASQTLTDSSFGVVAVAGPAGSVQVGGFHQGTITPAAQMPTVTATYNGVFGGLELSDPTTVRTLAGTTALTANFGAGTVQGSVSNLKAGGLATGYGLDLNGNISGNTYTGTTSFTGGGGNVTSSALNGAFYGANAAETAGALALTGRTPIGSNVAITGAYGAKK